MDESRDMLSECRKLFDFLAEKKNERQQALEPALEQIDVGMGEFKTGAGNCLLVTHNLGSCMGVGLYHRPTRRGALLHIKLPAELMLMHREKLTAYADSALMIALGEFEKGGIDIGGLEAKIAGGAKMYPTIEKTMDIGASNVQSVRKVLARCGIRILKEDTGGSCGRTMTLDLCDGRVTIFAHGKEDLIL